MREDPTALSGRGSSVTTIRPTRGWVSLKLNEFVEYRELLFFLLWRDVKVRYKQTVLGATWALLQPFLLMVVFSIFLGHLAGVPSNGLPYPVFAFAALVPWTLFSQSLTGASDSLVLSANLVSKVYFPRIILPVAVAGSFLLDFAIAFLLLIGMILYYGIHPTVAVFLVPAFALFAFVTALAVGILLAAVNVRYRDVRYAVPFLAQVWLFATPVAYPSSIVPSAWRTVYGLNPMAGVVEGFRWALLGTGNPPSALMAVSAAVSLALLVVAVAYFKRVERSFADVI